MNPEDRLRVMEACLLLQRTGWKMNFALMMSMATIVAGMGLAADSPALVIGAMLIAPLMTPVLGIAASIAMVLGEALIRSALTVVLATAGVIGLGWLTGFLLPGDLMGNGEIIARTSPDVKDLVVAVAAGIAGSYATARPDMSSSLPGVAVAVALVPPLAVVGLTLEAGEFAFAQGAMLLYLTNLAGIITLSTVVFVLTGFVPANRLAQLGPRVALGLGIGLLFVLAISWPLTRASIQAANDADDRTAVEARVRDWNAATTNIIDDITVERSGSAATVTIDVVGADRPPDDAGLEVALEDALETDDLTLDVLWTQAQRASGTTVNFTESELRPVVEEWLADELPAADAKIDEFALGTGQLTLGVSAAAPAPEVSGLTDRLDAELGGHPEIALGWRNTVEETTDALRAAAEQWARETDVEVVGVRLEGQTVAVDVVGSELPPSEDIKAELSAMLGPGGTAQIWFTQRVLVVPTPPPTPTPVPEPTATPIPPTPTPNPGTPVPWFLLGDEPTPG